MTEQEAQEMIAEIRSVNPQKRHGQRLYVISTVLQRRGLPACVEIYTLTKSGKRAIFDQMATIDQAITYAHPDVREWLEAQR